MDDGHVVGIANELGVVVLDDWAENFVGAAGEEEDGALGECVAALLTAARLFASDRLAVSTGGRGVESLGRVGFAAVVGTKVVDDIAEELVVAASKRLLRPHSCQNSTQFSSLSRIILYVHFLWTRVWPSNSLMTTPRS